MDDWDASILDIIYLHKPIHSIAQYTARLTTMIIIASDGSSSESDNIMTFGWKIVLEDSTLLATYAGQAFGNITSFQSK
eukprot:3022851-Ditylum_brightwellii.AAC.1